MLISQRVHTVRTVSTVNKTARVIMELCVTQSLVSACVQWAGQVPAVLTSVQQDHTDLTVLYSATVTME